MAIKCQCNDCEYGFNVRDEFAGKKIKCPKCQGTVAIPQKAAPVAKPLAAAGQMNQGLMGLLDEAGVQAKEIRETCPQCSSPLMQGDVVCVECGFNMATGEQYFTTDFAGGMVDGVQSPKDNAEQLIERAEKEIDETPLDGESIDFGDGADSYAIAVGAGLIATVLLTLGIFIVFFMDSLTQDSSSIQISMNAAIWVGALSLAWILVAMFIESPINGVYFIITAAVGIIVLVTSGDAYISNPARAYGGFAITVGYSMWYAISRKGSLIFPFMLLILATVVGVIASVMQLLQQPETQQLENYIDINHLMAVVSYLN